MGVLDTHIMLMSKLVKKIRYLQRILNSIMLTDGDLAKGVFAAAFAVT